VLDPIHHECGVAATYRMGHHGSDSQKEGEKITGLIPEILTDLQNRGQLSAGISSYDPHRGQVLDTHKDNGTVAEVFRTANEVKQRALIRRYAGRAAIGHVRYATCGLDDPSYAQPFERHHGRLWKWFAFCFNGNIANYDQCRQNILSRGDYHLVRQTDTEIIMHHLSLALKGEEKPDFKTVFQHLNSTFDGAYTLALLNADGDLIIARDPHGFRPLCYAVKGDIFAAASESHPLERLNFGPVRNVEPGTLVHVRPDGYSVKRFADSPKKSFCFFEWVYFSNAASTLNDISVYVSRRRLGEELARAETEKMDENCIIVPVPDTSRAAADAMAHELGIPCYEGLMRNRYVGRTFIESKSRFDKARRKYTPVADVLQGKRVFLVEDSIVRSTTLRVIVGMIRGKGEAKEVHVRVACPPIMAPCSYGIDMSTVSELFAPRFLDRPVEGELPVEVASNMAKDLCADSLRYLPLDALAKCIGLPERDLCMGCLTSQYPTEWGNRLYQIAERHRDERMPDGVVPEGRRTYESVGHEEQPPVPPERVLPDVVPTEGEPEKN